MTGGKRILIIDDDPDFLDYVQIILSANGYSVQTAQTAEAGLEAMRRAPPHLVIVDVMMSYVLDGWSVGRQMKHDPVLAEVPVLMVSAIVSTADDELFPTSNGVCFDGFLSKPIAPETLLHCVGELVDPMPE
jgi:DNA-binding response OmpR family regulator